MLEIKNLKKVYKIGRRGKLEALKDINLKFGNKGLIFIVGKSGSGKSTLLNQLGGLDIPTKGKIYCDGIDVYANKKQLNLYRRNCIGFIFQDYCLIESMTVYDNIELGLSVNGVVNHELIMKTIEELGLTGKENTMVNLLSGGQKQRVAIGRALLKNPNILLADEPTGNLDSKTSSQIFDILKEQSKERLVIVISHNLNEAFRYGDRVIELSDGNIISDLDRVDFDSKEKRIAFLPVEVNVEQEELDIVNQKIDEHNILIGKNEMLFKEHTIDQETEDFNYSKTPKPLKRKIKLYSFFIKKRLISIFVHAAMFSTLIFLIGLCQAYYTVDEDELYGDAVLVDEADHILRKGHYNDLTKEIDSDFLGQVTNEDIETFAQAGYEGNIYKLYKYPVPIMATIDPTAIGREDGNIDFSNSYLLNKNGYGVLITDYTYLNSIYGINNELVIESGDLDETSYGIIVTDYFADSIISKNSSLISPTDDKYEKLTTSVKPLFGRYKINAVIDTDYENRYEYVIEKFIEMKKFPAKATMLLKELKKEEIFLEFLQEVRNYLGITYTFNPNFIEDTLSNWEQATTLHYLENVVISDENNIEELYYNKNLLIAPYINTFNTLKTPVSDGEAYVSAILYNRLFSTNVTSKDLTNFVERDIYINTYTSNRTVDEVAKITKKITIKGIINYNNEAAMIISENDYKDIRREDLTAYAVYFDESAPNLDKAYLVAESMNYRHSSPYLKAIKEIADFSVLFKTVFMTLMIGLIATGVVLLSNYSNRLVKSFKRELGIIKAIGGKNRDFRVPFMIIVLIIGFITAIISTIAILTIVEFVNQVIVDGVALAKGVEEVAELELLNISPLIIFYDLGVLFILIILSILSPIWAIRRIKIVDILRRE